MPGSTPVFGFPYPDPSDLVANYPALGQQLAEDVEDAIVAASPDNASAEVTPNQTTTSTSYTDLATAGPAVTLTTGTKALVVIGCSVYNTGISDSFISWAVSGATTVAANDKWSVTIQGSNNTIVIGASRVYLITGLTAGSNTFTAKYRVAGGTGGYQNRHIAVIDMGS